mgnify:CR=1 FL=1
MREVVEVQQRHIQTSAYKNLLILSTITSIGIFGRVLFQFIPSVEPLTALAIAIGYFYGIRQGIFVGAVGFFASNFFVWGFQGPWTIFQVAGAALAATAGALIGRMPNAKNRMKTFIVALALGTILFEIAVNIGWGLMLSIFAPISTTMALSFMGALPFAVIHIASSIGFGAILYEFRDRLGGMIKGDEVEYKISRSWVGDGFRSFRGSAILRYPASRRKRAK